MSAIITRPATLALLIILCACHAATVVRGSDKSLPLEARSYLSAEARAGFSGVALIARSGEPSLHAAFGDGQMETSSRFWIGSLTKPIVATAILKLQEQGKLSVEDPITRFFADVPADKRGITVHQLLTHTSGLPHEYVSEGIVEREAAVKAILALPLEREPGMDASYSNDGYSLLGAIVESAAGMPYEEYLRRSIFQPAGMSNTGHWPPAAGARGFARIANAPSPANSVPNWGFRGGAGLYSTSEDLFRFVTALVEGRIISAASVDLAMGPRFPRAGKGAIGYGWFLGQRGGETYVTHSGAEDGLQHFGYLYWVPSRRTTVVLLSNNKEERALKTRDGLLDVVLPRSRN